MSVRLSTGLREKMLGTVGLKGAFANGVLYIYTGAQPATADAAVGGGTLLVKITLASGAFSFGAGANGINFDSPSGGVISKAAAETWSGIGLANGTAGWFRMMGNATDNLGSSTSLPRLDGTCATVGGDMNMNIAIVTSAPTTIDVFRFTLNATA